MSELESLITYDMYILGYDSNNLEDVQQYWKARLA